MPNIFILKYEISEKAFEDIENIWFYTAKTWSVEQADRYYNVIFDEIDYLAEYPFSGRDYGHIRNDYRCSIVKSHLIFYRLKKNEELVEIIRILHQSMDIEERLKD